MCRFCWCVCTTRRVAPIDSRTASLQQFSPQRPTRDLRNKSGRRRCPCGNKNKKVATCPSPAPIVPSSHMPRGPRQSWPPDCVWGWGHVRVSPRCDSSDRSAERSRHFNRSRGRARRACPTFCSTLHAPRPMTPLPLSLRRPRVLRSLVRSWRGGDPARPQTRTARPPPGNLAACLSRCNVGPNSACTAGFRRGRVDSEPWRALEMERTESKKVNMTQEGARTVAPTAVGTETETQRRAHGKHRRVPVWLPIYLPASAINRYRIEIQARIDGRRLLGAFSASDAGV